MLELVLENTKDNLVTVEDTSDFLRTQGEARAYKKIIGWLTNRPDPKLSV